MILLSAVVTIRITDVNDVTPEFSQVLYTRPDLLEEALPGTLVIQVMASDEDLGLAGEVLYSITEGMLYIKHKIKKQCGKKFLK